LDYGILLREEVGREGVRWGEEGREEEGRGERKGKVVPPTLARR